MGSRFVDTSVMDAISYFVGMGNYVIQIALNLGRLLTFAGFIWTCLLVVMGQKKMADMLVGTAAKWLMFFLVFSMYPGFCAGLRKLSTEIGNKASGTSISFINREITSFFTQIEELIAANDPEAAMEKAQLDVEEEFRKRREEVDEVYKTQETGVRVKDDELMALAQAKDRSLSSATKKAQKKSGKAYEKAKKKFEEKLAAFKDVLIIDESDQLSKYKMDLSLKTASGADTGFISPNSVFKVVILITEIMAESEFTQMKENGVKENIGTLFLPNLQLKRLQNIILSGVCAIGMTLTCVCVLIQYIMAIIEYAIIASFAVLLVPCMLFDGLKDLFNKILPSLMAQAIKLVMIIVCLYWCILSFVQIGKNIILNDAAFDFKIFGFVIFNLVLIVAICSNAPKLATTLLTGQPQMSMGEFAGAALGMFKVAAGAAVAAGALGKLGSGIASVSTNIGGTASQSAGAAKQAFNDAKASGKSGLKSTLSGAGAFAKETARQAGGRLKEGLENVATGNKGSASSFKVQAQYARQKGSSLTYGDYLKQREAQGSQRAAGVQGGKLAHSAQNLAKKMPVKPK